MRLKIWCVDDGGTLTPAPNVVKRRKGPGQSRLILCLRNKAHHKDGVPRVVPAKAGTQGRKLLCDIRACNERRAWIPACAGMTRLSERAASLTASESLSPNGNGRLHSRRDCPAVRAPEHHLFFRFFKRFVELISPGNAWAGVVSIACHPSRRTRGSGCDPNPLEFNQSLSWTN